MSQEKLIETISAGTYYYPAIKRYANDKSIKTVICDRCYKANLSAAIGYQSIDLCLPCVEIIIQEKNNPEATNSTASNNKNSSLSTTNGSSTVTTKDSSSSSTTTTSSSSSSSSSIPLYRSPRSSEIALITTAMLQESLRPEEYTFRNLPILEQLYSPTLMSQTMFRR